VFLEKSTQLVLWRSDNLLIFHQASIFFRSTFTKLSKSQPS